MRKVVKTVAALIMVIGVASASASSIDSASFAAYCKVMPVEQQKQYRVIYQSPSLQQVEIKLVDASNHTIYTEKLEQVTGFVKNYDLSSVAEGVYTLKITSGSEVFTQQLYVGVRELKGMHIASPKDGKVAITGKNDAGVPLSLYIYDEAGNAIYNEKIGANADVAKLYDLGNLRGKQVSFVIYENDRVLKTADVKL